MITLRSSDEEVFEVPEAVIKMCQTIRDLIEDGCAQNMIPIYNVSAEVLEKVIEYCKMHVPEKDGGPYHNVLDMKTRTMNEKEVRNWDQDYLNVDNNTIFDLIWAANYLNIKELLDLTCKKIADQMAGKSPEEIRKIFHIKNDFTSEEEAEIRNELKWAFD